MNSDNDVLRTLAEARPRCLADLDLLDHDRQEDTLRAILSQPRGSAEPTGPNRPVRHLRLAVPIAAAVAALAAIGVSPLLRGTAEPNAPVEVASPQVILSAAANNVLNIGASTGRYWHVATRTHLVDVAGTDQDPYLATHDDGLEYWSSQTKGGDSWFVTGIDEKSAPLGPSDAAAWKRAGSPQPIIPARLAKLGERVTIAKPTIFHNMSGGYYAVFGGGNVSLQDLQTLPANFKALTDYLAVKFQRLRSSGTAFDGPKEQTAWMFDELRSLLVLPVSSQMRAAACQAIAALPGVRSLGRVTDPMGRVGSGVAMDEKGQTFDVPLEQQLIVDDHTGLPLSLQDVAKAQSKVNPEITVGTAVFGQTMTSIGMTDAEPAFPPDAIHEN
ncbi:MAG: CU044_5270 family protein [Kutzneria sp.]|nr:CU044_5270 family protein [Kutzneria sp.]